MDQHTPSEFKFEFRWEGREIAGGVITKQIDVETNVLGHSVARSDCMLWPSGRLRLMKGFQWDFASGAVDTPAMIYASAFHDAFWYMRNDGLLPKKVFGKVDKFFRRCLQACGEGWLRSWYAWKAVRIHSRFKDEKPPRK